MATKMMAVVLLNSNFVGDCLTTEDGERYLKLRHKFGVDIHQISDIFQRGFVYLEGQIIPITSIGSIILVEDRS